MYKHAFLVLCVKPGGSAHFIIWGRLGKSCSAPPLFFFFLFFLSLLVEIKRPVVELRVLGLSSPALATRVKSRTQFFLSWITGEMTQWSSGCWPRNQLWFSWTVPTHWCSILDLQAHLNRSSFLLNSDLRWKILLVYPTEVEFGASQNI